MSSMARLLRSSFAAIVGGLLVACASESLQESVASCDPTYEVIQVYCIAEERNWGARLVVNGDNSPGAGWVTDEGIPHAGAYGSTLIVHDAEPKPITLTITDITDPNCSAAVEVQPIERCEDVGSLTGCSMSVEAVQTSCEGSGSWSVRFTLSGQDASPDGWISFSNGARGIRSDYGHPRRIGDFFIVPGRTTHFTFVDYDDGTCSVGETVQHPAGCQ